MRAWALYDVALRDISPEDRDNMFLRNFYMYLQVHNASQARRTPRNLAIFTAHLVLLQQSNEGPAENVARTMESKNGD